MAGLLTIVVPVYNEADSLEPLHAEIVTALTGLGAFEVVYVDDGSTDRSVNVMERLAAAHDNVRVVQLRRNFGKATALTHGFAEARGSIIVTMDGDRQDDPGEVPRMVARLDDGFDLVSGWKQRRQDPITKTLPSKFFNWTVRRTTGLGLHDFNCGLKVYRREVVQSIHVYGELHRYIPVLADDAGFRVTEEKVTHRRRMAGYSKYGWRRYMRGYLDLFTVLFLGRYRHRPQHLFGALGTFMVFVGIAIDLYLTIMKVFFGEAIGNRPLFVFANLIIVVGVQLFSVGLVSELLAFGRAREGIDEFEVRRRIDSAAARAALGPEGTQAALAAAAAREFGDEPVPEEKAARSRREADRKARMAARSLDAERSGGAPAEVSRREAPPSQHAGAPPSSSREPAATDPASAEVPVSDEIARRARLKAESYVAEAERTMGGDLRAADAKRDTAGGADADERAVKPRRPADADERAARPQRPADV
jgi:glycosyltransferase involved in cell wall biosynthesis